MVDHHFQWRCAGVLGGFGALVVGMMGFFLYQAHGGYGELPGMSAQPALLEKLVAADRFFLVAWGALTVAAGVALGLWGLIITHRVCGPLFVVTRYLGELSEGRYPDTRVLRDKDFLDDFYVAFESTVNTMRDREITRLQALEGTLNEALKAQEETPSAGLQAVIETMQGERGKLLGALGGMARRRPGF